MENTKQQKNETSSYRTRRIDFGDRGDWQLRGELLASVTSGHQIWGRVVVVIYSILARYYYNYNNFNTISCQIHITLHGDKLVLLNTRIIKIIPGKGASPHPFIRSPVPVDPDAQSSNPTRKHAIRRYQRPGKVMATDPEIQR
jgi:hypothetical protein